MVPSQHGTKRPDLVNGKSKGRAGARHDACRGSRALDYLQKMGRKRRPPAGI
jgi:hypothetical protein